MAEQKSEPEKAADAQPAAEQEVTNSEDAQEAVDVYRAGVANANAGDAEVVTPQDAPVERDAPAPETPEKPE